LRSVIMEEERVLESMRIPAEAGTSSGVSAADAQFAAAHRPRHLGSAVAEANRIAENAREMQKKKAKRKRAAVEDVSDEAPAPEGYERRLHLNRQSAAAARVRRETYIKTLESSLSAMESENIKLEEQVSVLRSNVAKTQGEIEKLNLKLHYMSRALPETPVPPLDACESNAVLEPEHILEPTSDPSFQFFDFDKDDTDPILQQYLESYPTLADSELPISPSDPSAPAA